LRLNAAWAGGSDEAAHTPLDAALIFAPVGALVPCAARDREGWCSRMRRHPYERHPVISVCGLWGARRIVSVANLTRADGIAFMKFADEFQIDVAVTRYPLADANRALDDLRAGRLAGAAVLTMR
jgi:alcohol dehydrogenase, propanol-preferring